MPPTAAFTSLNALQRERHGGQRSVVGHVSNFQVLANGCDFVKGLYMTRRTYRRAAAEAEKTGKPCPLTGAQSARVAHFLEQHTWLRHEQWWAALPPEEAPTMFSLAEFEAVPKFEGAKGKRLTRADLEKSIAILLSGTATAQLLPAFADKRALAMERQGNAKADELGNAKADEQEQDEQKKAVAQDASADAKMSNDTVDVPLGSVLGRLVPPPGVDLELVASTVQWLAGLQARDDELAREAEVEQAAQVQAEAEAQARSDNAAEADGDVLVQAEVQAVGVAAPPAPSPNPSSDDIAACAALKVAEQLAQEQNVDMNPFASPPKPDPLQPWRRPDQPFASLYLSPGCEVLLLRSSDAAEGLEKMASELEFFISLSPAERAAVEAMSPEDRAFLRSLPSEQMGEFLAMDPATRAAFRAMSEEERARFLLMTDEERAAYLAMDEEQREAMQMEDSTAVDGGPVAKRNQKLSDAAVRALKNVGLDLHGVRQHATELVMAAGTTLIEQGLAPTGAHLNERHSSSGRSASIGGRTGNGDADQTSNPHTPAHGDGHGVSLFLVLEGECAFVAEDAVGGDSTTAADSASSFGGLRRTDEVEHHDLEMLDEDTIHLTKTVTELKRQGDAAMATGQLTKAAVTYTQAVEMDRHNDTGQLPTLFAARSTVLHKLGREADAAMDLQRCIDVEGEEAVVGADMTAGDGGEDDPLEAVALQAAAGWRRRSPRRRLLKGQRQEGTKATKLKLQLACVQAAPSGSSTLTSATDSSSGAMVSDVAVVGAIVCLLNQPQPASVIATTRLRVVRIPRTTVTRAFDYHHAHAGTRSALVEQEEESDEQRAKRAAAAATAASAAATKRKLTELAHGRLRFLVLRRTAALAAQLRVAGRPAEAAALEERARVATKVASAASVAFHGTGGGDALADPLMFKRLADNLMQPNAEQRLVRAAADMANHTEVEVDRYRKSKPGDVVEREARSAAAMAASTVAAAAELDGRQAVFVPSSNNFNHSVTLPPATRFQPSRRGNRNRFCGKGVGTWSETDTGVQLSKRSVNRELRRGSLDSSAGVVQVRRTDAAMFAKSQAQQSAERARAATLAKRLGAPLPGSAMLKASSSTASIAVAASDATARANLAFDDKPFRTAVDAHARGSRRSVVAEAPQGLLGSKGSLLHDGGLSTMSMSLTLDDSNMCSLNDSLTSGPSFSAGGQEDRTRLFRLDGDRDCHDDDGGGSGGDDDDDDVAGDNPVLTARYVPPSSPASRSVLAQPSLLSTSLDGRLQSRSLSSLVSAPLLTSDAAERAITDLLELSGPLPAPSALPPCRGKKVLAASAPRRSSQAPLKRLSRNGSDDAKLPPLAGGFNSSLAYGSSKRDIVGQSGDLRLSPEARPLSPGPAVGDPSTMLAEGAQELRMSRRRSTRPDLVPVSSYARKAGIPFQTGTSIVTPETADGAAFVRFSSNQ